MVTTLFNNISLRSAFRALVLPWVLFVAWLILYFNMKAPSSSTLPVPQNRQTVEIPSLSNADLNMEADPSWKRLNKALFSKSSNPRLLGAQCQPRMHNPKPSKDKLESIPNQNDTKFCPDPEWSSFDEHHVLRINKDVGKVNVTVTRQDPHPPGTLGYGIDYAPPPEWKTYSTPLTVCVTNASYFR